MVDKEAYMPKKLKKDDLFIVIISSKKERKNLYDYCLSHNIPILYKEIFTSRKLNRLYGISRSGVGLVGTIIARNTPKDNVFSSLEQFTKWVASNKYISGII